MQNAAKTRSVSIIVPTFNRAHFLKQTLDSCFAQTYPCEIIVCDHGSTDNTPALMRSYPQAKYIRREEDFGPHFCWLDGLLHATGEYVHLQYDDDWILPNFIEKCMEVMAPDVGFVISECDLFDEATQTICASKERKRFPRAKVKVVQAERFVLEEALSPGSVVLRRQDAIDAIYPGRLPFEKHSYRGVGPDHWMTLLPLLRYKYIGYLPQRLAVFRFHAGSITVDAAKDADKQVRIRKAYEEVRSFYQMLRFCKHTQLYRFVHLLSWFGWRKTFSSIRKRIKKHVFK
ncbi:MAG: hypothetical protein A2Y14_00170 [Verrucomicrobia bacterium GWF2_51_19]|nr:MAG: hypothetical protein A2Y14_00170 [Verrucomicrobia bacterium GWF2_51_19]HCJ11662.1 glycosyltransferase family 2 protein [Opitutae bacterium]